MNCLDASFYIKCNIIILCTEIYFSKLLKAAGKIDERLYYIPILVILSLFKVLRKRCRRELLGNRDKYFAILYIIIEKTISVNLLFIFLIFLSRVLFFFFFNQSKHVL